MDLRWILTSLALSLPAAAQDAPAATEAVPVAAPPAPAPAPAEQETPAPAPAAPTSSAAPTAAPAPTPAATPSAAPASSAAAPSEAPAPTPAAADSAPAPTQIAAPRTTPAPAPSDTAPAATPRPSTPAVATPQPSPSSRPSAGHAHGHAHGGPSGFEELAQGNETDAQRVEKMARVAFDRFLAGDARFIVRGCAYPFYLDARRIEDRDTLFRELLQQLRSRRLDLLSVDAIRVFTPAEMEATYGPPPARLAHLPWKAPQTWIAVANLSDRAAVAMFQNTRNGWRMVAYTD